MSDPTPPSSALPHPAPTPGSGEGPMMSLGDHIEDLRRRLILAIGGVIPIVVLAFIFGQPLVELLIHPVQDALRRAGLNPTLQSTGVFEMFGAYVRVAIIAAILVGSPWLLYQLWRFVAPGLYDNERRFVYFLIPMSVVLSIAGVMFLYWVILPVVLAFFIDFGAAVGDPNTPTLELPEGVVPAEILTLAGDPTRPAPGQWWVNTDLQQLRVAVPTGSGDDAGVLILGSALTESAGVVPQYRISEYIKSFLSMALAFGGGFQMPVVILLLGWARIIEPKWLSKYRRHALLGCCLVSAILTPADPLSLILLAIPLYFLYEFGIILLRFMPPSRVARGFWRGAPKDADPDDAGAPRSAGPAAPSPVAPTGGRSASDVPGTEDPGVPAAPTGGRSRFDYFDDPGAVETGTDDPGADDPGAENPGAGDREHSDAGDERLTDAYGEYIDDRDLDENRPDRPGDMPPP